MECTGHKRNTGAELGSDKVPLQRIDLALRAESVLLSRYLARLSSPLVVLRELIFRCTCLQDS
jgi:hypothetical protein